MAISHLCGIFRLAVLLLVLHAGPASAQVFVDYLKYGVQDDNLGRRIDRVNHLAHLRQSMAYHDLETALLADRQASANNPYAYSRLTNELAELYSYQLLDLESAVAADLAIQGKTWPDTDDSRQFAVLTHAASQRVVAAPDYVRDFVNLDTGALMARSRERLATNLKLLQGERPGAGKQYDQGFLRQHLAKVEADIKSTHAASPERRKILSRLIKAEYELSRTDPTSRVSRHAHLIDGDLPLAQVDLDEIDFLSLADYLQIAYRQSGNVKLAELALEAVYLPYINLRDPENRWRYNKLVNDYVSRLVGAYVERGRGEEALYFITLNKSRLLLEERLVFSRTGSAPVSARLADLIAGDPAFEKNGLPSRARFLENLRSASNYVDFYVSGAYRAGAGKQSRAAAVTMPLSTRSLRGVEGSNDPEETFVDDALFVTLVRHGRVEHLARLSGQALTSLKQELERSHEGISRNDPGPVRSPQLSTLIQALRLPESVIVSPDKWISRHPLAFHLERRVTRSVNLLTLDTGGVLPDMKVVGFFNPTLDLPGAEEEAAVIRSAVGDARLHLREQASLQQLSSLSPASNVLHLSMHGWFNPEQPAASKLFFAGAQLNDSPDDRSALYASQMGGIPALRGRDLIFAAACETGKVGADKSNASELQGILRPLTANRNRNVILSLWEVDDVATRDFVAWFYESLAASRNVGEAFHSAQQKTKQKYPHPFYWAAFYLSRAN